MTPARIPTYLVTGCAGFIGAYVARHLLREGHRVVGVDNLNAAYDVRLKQWRLDHLLDLPAFTFHHLDICDVAAVGALLGSICDRTGCDAVINLAARAGVRDSLRDPRTYYETNLTGVLHLLEWCRTLGIKKFVQASTSSVYGRSARPFREDKPTDQPLSPYAASKKASEVLCYTYHELYGLDVTVLRFFTVFGPAGRPDMSVFRFIRWIAEDEPVILFGDGTQERDFTYVEDIARGTVLALRPVGYEIMNLGSDHPVSVRKIIETLETMLGRKAQIEPQPAHPADVPATWADITKARTLLEWKPEMSLEDGLAAAVRWYQQERSWASQVDLKLGAAV